MTAQDIDAMTPEQLRVAVAESQRWSSVKANEHGVIFGIKPGETRKWPVASMTTLQEPVMARSIVPGFDWDRNALAPVLAKLTPCQGEILCCHLVKIIKPSRIDGYDPDEDGAPTLSWHGLFCVITASPEQMCRAVLKALL